jgi:hypothetical protein
MLRTVLNRDFFPDDPGGALGRNIAWQRRRYAAKGAPVSWGVSAAVHALETALETALPAEAEAVTNPPSVVEEAPSASAAPSAEPIDVLLPRRRPTVPPGPAPGDTAPGDTAPRDTAARNNGTSPAEPAAAQPARPPRQAPDLAVLDQVLRGLQRMA